MIRNKFLCSLLCAMAIALMAINANADLMWTGATSGNVNIFSSDYNSGAGSISSGTLINDNVIYDGISVTAQDNDAFNEFLLGDTFTLTVSNSSITTAASGGFNGPSTGSAIFNVVNSTLDLQYVAAGLDMFIDGNSSLILRGGGDPINSQTNQMSITIAQGGMLTLASVAEFTEQGSDIFSYDSTGALVPYDAANFSFTGNNATALFTVPEPKSLAMLSMLAATFIFLRRRR